MPARAVRANLLGCLAGPHNLQQRHDMSRAEEVGTHDAVCSTGLLADQRDVDGGRVAGQDRVWPACLLQVCKNLLLQGNVLHEHTQCCVIESMPAEKVMIWNDYMVHQCLIRCVALSR